MNITELTGETIIKERRQMILSLSKAKDLPKIKELLKQGGIGQDGGGQRPVLIKISKRALNVVKRRNEEIKKRRDEETKSAKRTAMKHLGGNVDIVA